MKLAKGQFASPTPLHTAWGANFVQKIANPAAGKSFGLPVPGGWAWSPVSLRFTIKASAQAGERRVGLFVKDGGGNTLLEILPESVVEPSKTATYSFARDAVGALGVKNANSSFAMPLVVLEHGWELGDATTGLQTEDQIEGITLWVEQFEIAFDHTLDEAQEAIRQIHEIARAAVNG